MATVNPTLSHRGGDTDVATFALTSTNRDGAPIPVERKKEIYASVTGTWGGATVVMQGSNDGSNWFTLDDRAGVAVSLTADGASAVADLPLLIRPYLSVAGAGADLTAIVVTRALPA